VLFSIAPHFRVSSGGVGHGVYGELSPRFNGCSAHFEAAGAKRAGIQSSQRAGRYRDLLPLETALEMTDWQLPAAVVELGNQNPSRGRSAAA